MAPFDPNPPSARDKRIARQPKGKPTARKTSSSRIEDRRSEPFVKDPTGWGDKIDYDAWVRHRDQPLTPGGRQMMTPEPNLGRSDQLNRNRSYSTSMAANMNAYFNRLMAQPTSAPQESIRYEDGSVGQRNPPPTRYGEVPYGDVGNTQQQFREAQRQAMLRSQARRILEGGQPSTSQMLTQSNRANLRTPDISEYFVDPVHGQADRRQYPNGERYYEAGNVPTLAAALAERRKLMPQLPPEVLARFWNRGSRPFSPGAMQGYQG